MDRQVSAWNGDTINEDSMKLALWHTRTFTPITTHEDLEPIMVTLGFIGKPPWLPLAGCVAWRKYNHSTRSQWQSRMPKGTLPAPKLPYPRIDGLHAVTYRTFLEAINFYLSKDDISTVFHVRAYGMTESDRKDDWWQYIDPDMPLYAYRPATLDRALSLVDVEKRNGMRYDNNDQDNVLRTKESISSRWHGSCNVYALKDINDMLVDTPTST